MTLLLSSLYDTKVRIRDRRKEISKFFNQKKAEDGEKLDKRKWQKRLKKAIACQGSVFVVEASVGVRIMGKNP